MGFLTFFRLEIKNIFIKYEPFEQFLFNEKNRFILQKLQFLVKTLCKRYIFFSKFKSLKGKKCPYWIFMIWSSENWHNIVMYWKMSVSTIQLIITVNCTDEGLHDFLVSHRKKWSLYFFFALWNQAEINLNENCSTVHFSREYSSIIKSLLAC